MDPPHFLLDALNDSISSGTFIDTKFFVFSRREPSGRVSSPRALYCDSRILDTVPYFSSLFSDGFSEGQSRNIDSGFPSDSHPYTEDYDYLSDSDLEDGSSHSGEEEEELQDNSSGSGKQGLDGAGDSQAPQAMTPNNPSTCPSSVETTQVQNGDSAGDDLLRMGRVAIIRDIGAATFEAALYFLYTGEITFSPFRSDPCQENSTEARTGDWTIKRVPSPSAKSIYRLADKYDIPLLKEQAEAHIRKNLENCDIIEEIFSTFTYFFPEMLSMQVSFLVRKMNEESKWTEEGATRMQLRNKIASLSLPQTRRAAEALAMIWSRMTGPLESLVVQPKIAFSTIAIRFRFPNWHRVKLAFLKSITTGVFIDVQFYAFNKIDDGSPQGPKPLYTSSVVIEEWGPAIATLTVGIDSQAACLVDDPIDDDYEIWNRGPLSETHQSEPPLKYRTEAIAGSRDVLLLMSGAWNTWISFLSYAHTNEMTFSPLPSVSVDKKQEVQDGTQPQRTGVHRLQTCSPRSMYALATTLGIEDVRGVALKNIKSQLSISNVLEELFSSFAANHTAIMEMEMEFLCNNVTKMDPKTLTDHIQSAASGEAQFFPVTLSLMYDKLVEKSFPKDAPSNSGTSRLPGKQSVAIFTPFQVSNSASITTSAPTQMPSASGFASNLTPIPGYSRLPGVTPSLPTNSSSSGLSSSVPTPTPAPSTTPTARASLICARCRGRVQLAQLYGGLRCPLCTEDGRDGRGQKGRPFMRCSECSQLRVTNTDRCPKGKCSATFL